MTEYKKAEKTLLKTGQYHVEKGNLEKALESFRTTTKFFPKSAEAYACIADILFSQKKYQEVIENAYQAIGLDPKNVVAYSALGRTFLAQANIAAEEREIEKAIQSYTAAWAYFSLAAKHTSRLRHPLWKRKYKRWANEALANAAILKTPNAVAGKKYNLRKTLKSALERLPKRRLRPNE